MRHYLWEENYPGSSSGIKFHFYKMPTPCHDHDFFDLFVVTEGTPAHKFGGEEITVLSTGTLGIARPQDVHSFRTVSGVKATHFNVMISEPTCRAICSMLSDTAYEELMRGGRKPFYRLSEQELSHFRHMTDLIVSAEPDRQDMLLRAVSALLLTYLANGSQTEAPSDWLSEFIRRIGSSEYFLKPISELYRLVPYSRSILNRKFKETTGMTLIAFVTKLRIEYACNLLTSSDYSVIDVAEAASYDSLSHFNHVFKRVVGMTPSEYRKYRIRCEKCK